MAKLIEAVDGQSAYREIVETVRSAGRGVASRNGSARELEDVTIHLERARNALPLATGRRLNPRIAAAEALQLIGAFAEPEWLLKIAPQMEKYREPEGYFWGAYGDRVNNQLKYVARKLRNDSATRQAVAVLWHPGYDNIPDKLDYPCTVALGFSIRRGKLNARVTMRSNDVWLGLPYDLFQFTQLQLTLCHILECEPGTYTHTAWSLHLYDEHAEQSYELYEQPYAENFIMNGIGRPGWTVEGIMENARLIALEPEKVAYENLTESERWYFDLIHPSDLGRNKSRDGARASTAQPV